MWNWCNLTEFTDLSRIFHIASSLFIVSFWRGKGPHQLQQVWVGDPRIFIVYNSPILLGHTLELWGADLKFEFAQQMGRNRTAIMATEAQLPAISKFCRPSPKICQKPMRPEFQCVFRLWAALGDFEEPIILLSNKFPPRPLRWYCIILRICTCELEVRRA